MASLATCLLLLGAGLVSAENTYIAVVPRTVYPGTTLSIPIQFLVPVYSETVEATLKDFEDVTIATDTATITTQEVTLNLQIPSTGITWRNYNLYLSGRGSVDFRNETTLWGRPYTISIFVQTDKAIYKPGEKVQYRVFAVNSSLDLIETPFNIEVFDPKGNKIDEKMGVQNLLGIEGSLPLSDMPPLGSWRIKVAAKAYGNLEESTNFQVQEYVLPKFEVTVSLPSYGVDSQTSLKGYVAATYTFGKPVKGNVVLTVSREWSSGFFDARAIRMEFPIDGEAGFEVQSFALRRLSRNIQYETFRVHANVTETLTGITLDGQSTIRFYNQPYKLEFFPNMPSNFKPGFNTYEVLLKVTEQDDRPPAATNEKVRITTTYFTDSPALVNFPGSINQTGYDVVAPFLLGDTIMMETVEYPLDAEGMVNFRLNIPPKTATASIKAEFAGESVYKDISRFRSPGEMYLKAEAQTTGVLQIGQSLVIKLSTSNNVGDVQVTYIIQARDQIVATGTAMVSGSQHEGFVNLLLDRDMAPAAKFVAYFVASGGEIVADGINIPIEDFFENKVTIEFEQKVPVNPQSAVGLTVTAAPDSQVSVLVVDKSVLLLGGDGNDITPQRVKNALGSFGNFPIVFRGWGIVIPWSFTADDASDIFNDAQLTVLTDCFLYSFDLWSLDQPVVAVKGFGGGVMQDDMVAMSARAGVSGSPGQPEGQIRKDFPETWIWESSMLINGAITFDRVAPDTITEFVANAFALSPTKGLGVASLKSNLTVFKEFFVNLQLPYSVIRGEIVVIQANVFNYFQQPQNVEVVLKTSETDPEFIGITLDENGNEVETTEALRECIQIQPQEAIPIYFSVRPTIVGTMTVSVRATSQTRNIFDEVIRLLPVEAEGQEKADNYPVLIVNQVAGNFLTTVPINYPPGLVPQSERIRITLFGDVFGPSLENLESLIRMPYGCGEQNMLNFAPAVFAANYLKATSRFGPNSALEDKIKDVLRTGYQRQLLYQRVDGSFSAFGNADSEGSLWLTSFVAKSFAQAHTLNLVYIDPAVIQRAVEFILNYQQKDGSFINTGVVHHKAMQGGSAANVRSLTAYVLIALNDVKKSVTITDETLGQRLDAALQSAGSYLVSQLSLMATDYERAINTWALKEIDNPNFSTLLQALNSSPNRTVEGNSVYWKDDSGALQIEIISYVLQVYTSLSDQQNGIQLLNWLVKQRGYNGGFISTQDTIVALQALSSFASLIYTTNVDMSVQLYTMKGAIESPRHTLTLTSQNHDVLQYVDFPGNVDFVRIEASGMGLAMVDVHVLYNVVQEPLPPSYTLTLTTSDETQNSYKLTACASFDKPNIRSNMAILDIGGISGFEPMKDLVEMTPLIKRIETSGGRIVIYFEEIPSSPQCVNVPFQRVALVANVRPANVIVYSYYEPSERVMGQYMPTIFLTQGLCATCGAACGCGPTTVGRVRRCGPIVEPIVETPSPITDPEPYNRERNNQRGQRGQGRGNNRGRGEDRNKHGKRN